MSLPRNRTESKEDPVSSPDVNDNTTTEIHQEARLLEEIEETEDPEKPVGYASDADVSDSDSSIKTVLDAELSHKQGESSEKQPGSSNTLSKSPKKVHRRSKYDPKIHGGPSTRDDDSSDERESIYSEKSPKKQRYAAEEEMADSVEDSSPGIGRNPKTNLTLPLDSKKQEDSNGSSSDERCKSDTTDNKSFSSRHFKHSKSDVEENLSDVPVRSTFKKSPEKFKKSKSKSTEMANSPVPGEQVVSNDDEASFTLVKTSHLITAAVSNILNKQEKSPQAGTSREGTDTKPSIDSKTNSAEKERIRCRHSGADKLILHEGKNPELTAASTSLFGQVQGIINEDPPEQATELCNTQTSDVLRTESSEDSNISSEKMEFVCESSVDPGIEMNTDVEKMDYSSESCAGFESIKSGSEYRMELESESSVSLEEMEGLESASVKSTETEGMECLSESGLPESESIRPQENGSTINEGRTFNDSHIDEMHNLNTERESSPPILVENESAISNESESNSNEVTNINESISGETIGIIREFSIPRIEPSDTDEYGYHQNQAAVEDAQSNMLPTKLASEDRRPVAKKVPRVKVGEHSNMVHRPSTKRKKSTDDSDNGLEGEIVSNVSESTDIHGGAAAASNEFPVTGSDESKERKCTGSPRKYKKK